ncbi:MAG: 1-deoxy-D-xylulose-5-phosphate reductoisomerase [Acidobacteriota bacterium]|nr:1-deoxy-D-xylulose-5-phosphate reductoisomerase [Acidobacteriota bacterium]
MKRIAILGSTGSIGTSALAVVKANPDALRVVGLAAWQNSARLAEQVEEFTPAVIAMATPKALDHVRRAMGADGTRRISACAGPEGLAAVATHPEVDIVLCASAGTAALEAVLLAIEAGKTIALANKEVLVMAGSLVMEAARRHGVAILPVDSEHNAIHQCLHGRSVSEVRRLILTASGGPFREWSTERLKTVKPAAALRHPTWNMGDKITVDSATLMNKGLEVIEARWFFGMTADQVDVLVHPQSIVHSMVELRDGSVIAQLGITDMQLPIQYALSYPDRWDATLPTLDLSTCGSLEFYRPDVERFPCLALAYRALRAEGALPIVLNTANEVAVSAFLAGTLPFVGIPALIERALSTRAEMSDGPIRTLADVRGVDRWAREFSRNLLPEIQSV